jgi:hypothetical protein
MATITGMTAAKMQQIADASIVSGQVNELGNLILTTAGGTGVDAGAVMDPLLPGDETQYYRGDKTWQGLTKQAVGLSVVDNTSDALKPASTAQALLNSKAPLGAVAQAIGTGHTAYIGVTRSVILNVPSYSFKSGRKYRLHWTFEYLGTTPGNYASFDISSCPVADAANSINNLTKIGGSSIQIFDNAQGSHGDAYAYFNPTVDATLQLKATVYIWNGTGTVSVRAFPQNPTMFTLFDEGKQF